MKKLFLIIFSLFSFSVLSAQQIYFTESYTEKGDPIGAKNIWSVKPWGTSIFILLDNEGKPFQGNLVYLFIDKKSDDAFQPYDSKAVNVDHKKNWAAVNQKFTQPGEYEIYFINLSQEIITTEKLTLNYPEDIGKLNRDVNSLYYDNCKLVFCERVLVGDKPFNLKNSISISNYGSNIIVHLNNQKPLKTSKLLVDVWKKKNRSYEYDEFVESKKYQLNPDWNDAYFRYTFAEPGEYKFSIYNEKETLIRAGYFAVYK